MRGSQRGVFCLEAPRCVERRRFPPLSDWNRRRCSLLLSRPSSEKQPHGLALSDPTAPGARSCRVLFPLCREGELRGARTSEGEGARIPFGARQKERSGKKKKTAAKKRNILLLLAALSSPSLSLSVYARRLMSDVPGLAELGARGTRRRKKGGKKEARERRRRGHHFALASSCSLFSSLPARATSYA